MSSAPGAVRVRAALLLAALPRGLPSRRAAAPPPHPGGRRAAGDRRRPRRRRRLDRRCPGCRRSPTRTTCTPRPAPGCSSERGPRGEAAGLRAAHEVPRRLGDRPEHVRRGRPATRWARRAAARRAVVGHAHALRQRRQGRPAHPVRPDHRHARDADPGDRPVQPLLHPGRPLGDLGRRGAAASWCSTTRTPGRCRTRCPPRTARASTTPTSPPTGARPCSPASSPAGSPWSTSPRTGCCA